MTEYLEQTSADATISADNFNYPQIPISITEYADTQYPSWNRGAPWPAVVKMLQDWSRDPYESKRSAPLFSPTWFHNDIRAYTNGTYSAMLVFDGEHVVTIPEMVEYLRETLGVEAVVYSSASNRPDDPHFRILLPLPAWIDRHLYKSTAMAVKRLMELIFGEGVIDRTKLDNGCLFYVPGFYAGALNDFHHIEGVILSAQQWIEIADELAPEPPRDDIIEHREYEYQDAEPDDVIRRGGRDDQRYRRPRRLDRLWRRDFRGAWPRRQASV